MLDGSLDFDLRNWCDVASCVEFLGLRRIGWCIDLVGWVGRFWFCFCEFVVFDFWCEWFV